MPERINNFDIVLGPGVVYKIARPENPLMLERLRREATALEIVSREDPDLVPRASVINLDDIGLALRIERVENLGSKFDFSVYGYVIEKLQAVPVSDALPHFQTADYQKQAEAWLEHLKRLDPLFGLTATETKRIGRLYSRDLCSMSCFDTVLVHTDIQSRHVGIRGGKPMVIDFDQAHFGNELEDWAFLSVRHPRFELEIVNYLRGKFRGKQVETSNLECAFNLFQNHFLLKGYFDRTHQSRGTIFDLAAKAYARGKLFRVNPNSS